ncbi:hypothetical protein CIHG_03808 [Coccidioides immitis H538.4]|uniref:Uncharacterized protein n=1 Tax=Coccidioides immitis H538.4 TaxID=396776 RepID=A0A0J8UEL8_COCIT|nr:hypothetical protein CIHG_03808 [Coccidioides immitis H538.4]
MTRSRQVDVESFLPYPGGWFSWHQREHSVMGGKKSIDSTGGHERDGNKPPCRLLSWLRQRCSGGNGGLTDAANFETASNAGESDGVSSVQGRSTEGNALKIELFRFQGGILGSPPHSESETTRCTRAWQRYLRKYLMLVLSEQVQR